MLFYVLVIGLLLLLFTSLRTCVILCVLATRKATTYLTCKFPIVTAGLRCLKVGALIVLYCTCIHVYNYVYYMYV